MLHLITDVRLERGALSWAAVSLYWNSEDELYHVEAQGQWLEKEEDIETVHSKDRSYAWGIYCGRVHEFISKGMGLVHTEWR